METLTYKNLYIYISFYIFLLKKEKTAQFKQKKQTQNIYSTKKIIPTYKTQNINGD